MKNVLQHKQQRNKKYFKSKYLEKRHAPQIFLFYVPIKISVSKWNDQQNL